ncbi:TPR-like protein [Amanita muscaria]
MALASEPEDDFVYSEDALGSSDSEESVYVPEESENDQSDVGEIDQGEANAEHEIEGDFNRLVQIIRLRDASNTNVLAKDWDVNTEEKEAEFRDDLREASGIGRRKKKRGRKAGPTLSLQVRSLIGDGNQAYVDNNIPDAMRIMQEVIRIEPKAVAAWSVLAQCYSDMHQEERALQLRIMAAHLTHDAEEWDRLARQSRDMDLKQQALYCYRKVHSLDPTNVHALWDRASLAVELGDFRTARTAYLGILKQVPHDLAVLAALRPILIELSDLPTCTTLFQQAFEHYQSAHPSGRLTDTSTSPPAEIPGGGFTLLEILVLADLYNTQGQYEEAIDAIRKGCRWLQGRAEQRYWNLCQDDREFDGEDVPPESRNVGEGDGVTGVEPGTYPLDINARHRLAVARIKMGDVEEGKIHANIVLSQDVLDYAPLFAEIADAYFEREMYADAKPVYELLGADVATSSIYILLQTAACLRMLNELKEAAEVYEHVRLADPTNNDAKMKLAEIYEILNEPRKALELVYEVIDSRKKRAKEASTATVRGPSTPAPSSSLFQEDRATPKTKTTSTAASRRLTHAQLLELEVQKEKDVLRGWARVQELWSPMLESMCRESEAGSQEEREWLMEAEKLVETFRETRNLFLTSRSVPFRGMFPRSKAARQQAEAEREADEDRMASRLHLDLEHESRKSGKSKVTGVQIFRGVSFDDWLRLFMQYAFLLTKRGQYEIADEILRHILVSNAYQARERQDSIRIALITCAIHAQRHTAIVEHARKLITTHQFDNEPFRILLASLSSGLQATDAFISSTLQKHLFREMKTVDAAVKTPELLKWNPTNKRYALMTQGKSSSNAVSGVGDDEDAGDIDENDMVVDTVSTVGESQEITGRPRIPTKHNPIIVTIYGQICIAAKSYQSAIFYLLHSYDYCPDDPMICLCLAIASIGRAMQRQSDNRHHLVTQAMAFLSKYRELRQEETDAVGEVEFNFGRAFHQLGLYSYAVKHYEKVFELAEKSESAERTLAREAAYNLSLIFVQTGAVPLADRLYRRWLSI